MNIEISPGNYKVKIGETEHELSLADLMTLGNAIKQCLPPEIRYGDQIRQGVTEFTGPKQGLDRQTFGQVVAPPNGWSVGVPVKIEDVIGETKGKEDGNQQEGTEAVR
jgi:hypothetical protein